MDISESAEDTGELKELVTIEDEKLVTPWAWQVEVTEGYVTAVEGDGKELWTGEGQEEDTGEEQDVGTGDG